MGLFKQLKQMKDVVAETPDLIENAQAMQEAQAQQAQAMQVQAAAASAAASQAAAHGAATGNGFDPIAGVSIELYADISKEITSRGGDQLLAPSIAAEKGVDRASWDAAVAGWNDRMRANPAIAKRFNDLWRGVG
ncbi:MAG: hypothetical protein AAGA42_14030 [Actinomycetota bacterium]